MPTTDEPPEVIDPRRPSIARVYDFLLGGKDNYAADRDEVARLTMLLPDIRRIAHEGRAFTVRAVRHLAAHGVRQFLDIGTGFPTADPVHQLAPDAHVVYIDHDTSVAVHGRALLATTPRTEMIRADLAHPDTITGDPRLRRLIDFAQPVGVIITGVLHHLHDQTAHDAVQRIAAQLAPGSHVVVTHLLQTTQTLGAAAACKGLLVPRIDTEITGLLHGLHMADPGLVPAPLWRPDHPDRDHDRWRKAAAGLPLLAGVGRKP